MPCRDAFAEALRTYIDAAGIAEDRKGWLFRTARGHNTQTSKASSATSACYLSGLMTTPACLEIALRFHRSNCSGSPAADPSRPRWLVPISK
jgi:hypothetical protein